MLGELDSLRKRLGPSASEQVGACGLLWLFELPGPGADVAASAPPARRETRETHSTSDGGL